MKIGLVTYSPEKVEGYDMHVFFSKWVDGQKFSAAKDMQNDVTCFCDAKAIREDPSIVAFSNKGPALRKNKKSNLVFDYVCPNNQEYRNGLIEYIKTLQKEEIKGITLNLYHFPDQEYCVCPTCVEHWRKSGLNWVDWRSKTITNFLKEVKSHVKGTFAVEMFPDPVLAKERFGINFEEIATLVDYFHVPLSAKDYSTNYWVDLLVRDFLKILKKPMVVELSGEMISDEKANSLLKIVAYLSRHNLMGILFLVHDTENARQIIRYAIKNTQFQEWLKNHEFNEMRKIIEKWKEKYL